MNRPPAWYMVLIAGLAAIRLRELAISRSHERATGGVPSAPQTYPLMVAVHDLLDLIVLLRREAQLLVEVPEHTVAHEVTAGPAQRAVMDRIDPPAGEADQSAGHEGDDHQQDGGGARATTG